MAQLISLGVMAMMAMVLMMAVAEAKTPPGIAKNPSHATCKIKKYKHCYNLVHVCPKFCPDECTVECASCKPICSGSSTPPPDTPSPPTETPSSPPPPTITPTPDTPYPPVVTPSPPPPTVTPTPSPPPPTVTPTPSPPPPKVTPTPYPPPPTVTPTPSPPPPTVTPTPSPPPPTVTPTPSPPPPTVPPTPYPPPPKVTPKPSPPPPTVTPTPSPPPPTVTPTPHPPPPTTTPTPSPPPPTVTPTPSSPPPPTTTPTPSSPPPTVTPTPSSPPPPTTTPTPETPSTPYPPPPTSTTPTPSSPPPPPPTVTPSPETPSPTPVTPSPPPPTTPAKTPPAPYSPPTKAPPADDGAGKMRARCRMRDFPQCYGTQHVCPASCPTACDVDCVACKPVCKCDQPGAVCQDPRFIGGDGITFYFHGKKDENFCLLSDPNLHINAHFIGKRTATMTRDFTWVQSLVILFGRHRLYIAAKKTAIWDDSVDRLDVVFDGKPISDGAGAVAFARTSNAVIVEVTGLFRIAATVVPITAEDSRIHNYGVTNEDCFAHLDLRFQFFSLSEKVSGVLGQTYRPDYQSRVNVAAKMPVLGGDREFKTSDLFASDCAVARFAGLGFVGGDQGSSKLPGLSCSSGSAGLGVVCKK